MLLTCGFMAGMLLFRLTFQSIFGGLSVRNGQKMILLQLMNENDGALFMCVMMFAIGLFFTFLAPPFLATKGRKV